MPTADRIAASGTVAATPAAVFRIVTDPAMHVAIDGSGMLEAAPGTKRAEKVGDTFVMDMDRESLGDQPMGKYKSVNTVTRIVPGELFEWNVGLPDQGPFGHVYGWEITAVGPNETLVTNYCAWPDIPEYARPHFPIVPLAMLEQSVENLAALVAREGGEPG
ncbi:MAG TPA: SRPBCC family protein [Acidimicrobiales bacterium]|nr:SRPBCC family protein [Acidimicrobiales bacterium]